MAAGRSWTMDSKHLTGRAVDVVATPGGQVSWEPRHYHRISEAFFAAAEELGLEITWGGHWTVRDYVHFELDP